MDKAAAEFRRTRSQTMHVPVSLRRQNVFHKVNMTQLPIITETRDYIVITKEILDAFKERVMKSNTVTLKLNPERKVESRSSERQTPNSLQERIRLLHSRASTSRDVRDTPNSYRPVRVFIDDVTKQFDQKSSGGSGERTSTAGEFKLQRRSIQTSNVSSGLKLKRSMDSGDEGGDGPDDVIETVARVNTMHIDHAPVLPEIRAAPCPIHIKRQAKGSLESGPFSKDLRSPRRVPFQSMKNITLQQNNNNTNNPSQTNSAAKPHRVDISVRIPEQFPTRPPPLPKNMTSKDYVMTWLIHGSDPQGSNHFPEIVPANNNKTRTKHSPRKAHVSE